MYVSSTSFLGCCALGAWGQGASVGVMRVCCGSIHGCTSMGHVGLHCVHVRCGRDAPM